MFFHDAHIQQGYARALVLLLVVCLMGSGLKLRKYRLYTWMCQDLSVKAGHWDGMRRKSLNAAAEPDGPPIDEIQAVQAAAPIDVDCNPKQSSPCQASGLLGMGPSSQMLKNPIFSMNYSDMNNAL
jgi:hypothetical protein